MKKPKENRDEIRDTALVIPLSREEKDMVANMARDKGITMASCARMLIRDGIRREVEP